MKDSAEFSAVALSGARRAFTFFLELAGRESRICILHDSDADGVSAGVVLQRALEIAGYADIKRLSVDRERNAWTESNRARVRELMPEALFVLDLGVKGEPIIENVPTCFIDHHRPEVAPCDTQRSILISAYDWQPIPNTSLIVYELCRAIIDNDKLQTLEWIATMGTISDLGERAPFTIVERAKKIYKAKWLKEATTLINASRRASRYDPEAAARALLEHESPQSLVESTSADVAYLRESREEVKREMNEAKKVAPVFSRNVALVKIDTRCQIHPLIAQIWRTRLPKYIVICANYGYLDGRVNFSARATEGTNVLDFLRGIELSEGEGNYGHGHDQASGGSLPFARWNELLEKLNFPADKQA